MMYYFLLGVAGGLFSVYLMDCFYFSDQRREIKELLEAAKRLRKQVEEELEKKKNNGN